MSRVCDGFQSHAFLRNKCRDCSRTEEEHQLYQSGITEEEDTKTQTKEDTNEGIEARPQSIAIEAHQHAFDHIDVLSPSNVLTSTLLCKKFQHHAWITDRCQDCGGTETSHKISSPHSNSYHSNHNTAALSSNSSTSSLTPATVQLARAEDQMRRVVARMKTFQNEYEKLTAADDEKLNRHEITQQEYDECVSALRLAFESKEAQLKREVDEAHRVWEDATKLKQTEDRTVQQAQRQ